MQPGHNVIKEMIDLSAFPKYYRLSFELVFKIVTFELVQTNEMR